MPAADPGRAAGLTGAIDWLIDLAVAAYATWTLIYWVCAATHVATLPAVIAWIALIPVCALLVPRGHTASDPGRIGAPRALLVVLAAAWLCALAAAVLFVAAPSSPFFITWILAMASAAGGACCAGVAGWKWRLAHRGNTTDVAQSEQPTPVQHRGRGIALAIVLLLAVAASLLSLFIVRPDADDVYYVNRSTYVAQHGTFPLRDTLYSDQRWPASETPPVSAYEPWVGAVSNLLHVQAPSLTYLVVPPLATFLMMLVLWRLLRVWRVRWAPLALAVALVFLLWGGVTNASFGNLSLDRIWQGKVLLLAIGIPLMFVEMSLWHAARSRRRLLMVLAAGVVVVGLSSSGVLEAPMVALAFAVPLLLQRQWRALLGCVLLVLPAIGVALLVHFVGGLTSASATEADVDPASLLTRVTGDGGIAVISILAMFGGWAALPAASGRVVVACAATLVAVLLAPHVMVVLNDLGGAGPVLWRMLDVVPAAALVGAMAVALMQARGRLALAGAALPVAAVVLMVVMGTPLWASSNGATLASRPQWKVSPSALQTARAVIAQTPAGSVIAAPADVSAALAITTSIDHVVDPRSFYLVDFSDAAGFDTPARTLIDTFTNGGTVEPDSLEAALAALHVSAVCLPPTDSTGGVLLSGAGYRQVFADAADVCFAS